MGLDPPLHDPDIGGHILCVGIRGQLLLRHRRALVVLQRRHMVPPRGPVPGKPLVQGVPPAPAIGQQGIGAVVQRVLVQQILDVIQGIAVVEIFRHGPRQAGLVPDQDADIHAEDHPLRVLGPEEGAHQLVELAVVSVGDGQPHRGGAEGLFDPAGPVVGGHGGAHQNGVRLHVFRQPRHLIPLVEQHRLPLVRDPVVQAGIHRIHDGPAYHQQGDEGCQEAAGPAAIRLLHTVLLRNWNR